MKRKIFSMAAGVCALAATVAFCGCGDGGAAAADAVARAPFAPLVRQEAVVALGVNLDKEQAFKLIDSCTDQMMALFKDATGKDEKIREQFEEVRETIEEFKKDPFKDAPKDLRAFLDDSGLRDTCWRWAVFSIEGPVEFSGDKPNMGGFAWAAATDADIENKIIPAVRKRMEETNDNSADFAETEICGEKVWRIVPKTQKCADDLAEVGADPYIASLDGDLILVALRRETMERQIRLYRNGEGKGDALGEFAAAKGDFMRLRLGGIGEAVAKNTDEKDLQNLSKFMPNGAEIAKGLKNFDIEIKMNPDGALNQSIALDTASQNDAEMIRTYLNGLLAMAKLQLAREKNVPQEVKKYLNAIQIVAENGKVEVKNAFVVAIMAGALFPAISSAMQNAQTSAMSMRGRNLFVGIIQANVDRQAHGLESAWPRTVAQDGAGASDLAGKAFASSAEYFAELFDIANYATPEWAPYVDIDAAALGKDAVQGKSINIAGLDWCIAANIDDTLPDIVPVLVSANFNPELLLRDWDGKTDATKPLPIGPSSGASKSMFGDKAIVVIYKGGAGVVIKKKYLNYKSLYMNQAFRTSHMKGAAPLMYLTPDGAAEPLGAH